MASSDEHGVEKGEEVGFTEGDSVTIGTGIGGEAGGGGVDGVHIVPDSLGAHASEGGEDPGEEEAIAGCGASGVFGGFLQGSSGDDGGGIVNGGWEVGGEEGAADGEVYGDGLFG